MGEDEAPAVVVELRRACHACGAESGYIEVRNGQFCTYCGVCDAYQYNLSRTDLADMQTRTSPNRKYISRARRARVLTRHGNRCVSCGAPAGQVVLHIGHLVPNSQKPYMNNPDAVDHELNLAPMCVDCNLGYSNNPIAVALMARLLEMWVDILEGGVPA